MRSVTVALAFTAALAVASGASLGVVRSDYDTYGDYKSYNLRKYTKIGEKCAGAADKPYVHYAPCTKGYHCVKKSSYSSYEWGLYCMPIPKYYAPKCYDDGARCMGAANKPYVPYFACCSKDSICKEVPSKGWGSFCVSKGYDYAPPKKYADKKVEGRCHITGVRCMGAPGYPYYEYGDGCCSKDDVCVTSSKGWGKFCVKAGYKESYAPEKVYAPKKDDPAYYPKVVFAEDKFGHKKWGGKWGGDKKESYNPKCIATKYYGCKVAAEHKFYYRMLATSRSYFTKDYTSETGCCSKSDLCYKGFCLPLGSIPGTPDGKKPDPPKGPGIPEFPKFPDPIVSSTPSPTPSMMPAESASPTPSMMPAESDAPVIS